MLQDYKLSIDVSSGNTEILEYIESCNGQRIAAVVMKECNGNAIFGVIKRLLGVSDIDVLAVECSRPSNDTM